jgi:hypothetical protein
MIKNDKIINIVYNSIGVRLDKSQLNSSIINQTGLYSVEPNYRRKEKDWHLVLIDTRKRKMYVFIIPANNPVYKKLYYRGDKDCYRLEFYVGDSDFREKRHFESFKKFLVGECDYSNDIF